MSFVHHDRSEAALEQVTRPSGARIDETRVAAVRLADGASETNVVAGDQNQVDMVGHQAPGPYLDASLACLLRQQTAVDVLIAVLKKDRLTPVATLCDVVGRMRNDNACEARHASMVDTSRHVSDARGKPLTSGGCSIRVTVCPGFGCRDKLSGNMYRVPQFTIFKLFCAYPRNVSFLSVICTSISQGYALESIAEMNTIIFHEIAHVTAAGLADNADSNAAFEATNTEHNSWWNSPPEIQMETHANDAGKAILQAIGQPFDPNPAPAGYSPGG